MSRSLLHLVLHHAEGFATPLAEPDSELLARFVRTRDEAAFAELLRRHASMVWAVCRQSLAADADAEDAFQATFLALIRSARSVKDGRALAGWLHGVAVRVALKRKRSAVRQRLRERRVAMKESDRPVPEAAWNALLAAVHEEVQRLPDALRTAFVMCELEGVRQAEAAERLGWKPGTLTGRLARARQALIERLGRRGLAPAVGGSLGLGLATATAEAPNRLIDTVMSLIPAGGAVSPALVKLASEGLPMVMRTKLAAAVLLVAGGLSAVLYPMANAQVRNESAPSIGVGSGLPPAPPTPPNVPPGPQHAVLATPPAAVPPGPATSHRQWEYRVAVGALDMANPLGVLDEFGKDGWEFCDSFPVTDEQVRELKKSGKVEVYKRTVPLTAALFKRPKGGANRGVAVNPASGGNPLPTLSMNGTAQYQYSGVPSGTPGKPATAPNTSPPRPKIPTARPGYGAPSATSPAAKSPYDAENPVDANRRLFGARPPVPEAPEPSLTTIRLRNAEAAEIAGILEKVFGRDAAEVTAVERTNSLIIRADDKTLQQMKKLLLELDAPEDSPPPPRLRKPATR